MPHGRPPGSSLKDFVTQAWTSLRHGLNSRARHGDSLEEWQHQAKNEVKTCSHPSGRLIPFAFSYSPPPATIRPPSIAGKIPRVAVDPGLQTSIRRLQGFKMHSYLQFISTPTFDTPGTGLMLVFDDRRYFFGQAHEGFQRVGVEQNIKFTKLKEVFVSGVIGLQTIGGLMGMTLTVAGAIKDKIDSDKESFRLRQERYHQRLQKEEERRKSLKPGQTFKPGRTPYPPELPDTFSRLGFHGGPNITHAIACARSFIFRQSVPLDIHEHAPDEGEVSSQNRATKPTWTDGRIQVWAMGVSPTEPAEEVPSSSRPSRKRSLHDYIDGQNETLNLHKDGKTPTSSSPKKESPQEFAVREMFRSEWNRDDLVEIPISEVVRPTKMWIRHKDTKKLSPFTGPFPDPAGPPSNLKVLVRKPWPGATITALPAPARSKVATSYIVRNRKQRGKFNMKAAIALGVKPGPLFRSLTKGETVLSQSGEEVTPEMVMEPEKDGAGFTILDIPSKDYLTGLISRPEWSNTEMMAEIRTFVWLLGPGLAEDDKLLDLIKQYPTRKHIVSSPELCANRITMASAALSTVQHRLIDPDRFPALQFDNKTPSVPPSPTLENIRSLSYVAEPGLKIQLEPALYLDQDAVMPPVNLLEALNSIPRGVHPLVSKAKNEVEKAREQSSKHLRGFPSPDAEITCLGTGSAAPSPSRNVSGTLLRVPGHGSYLFDAGENTLGQMRRRFNGTELAEILRDLKMIFISHMHADHHLGTAPIIKAWYEEVYGHHPNSAGSPNSDSEESVLSVLKGSPRLFVVGPAHMERWMTEFSAVEKFGFEKVVFLKPIAGFSKKWHHTRFIFRGTDLGLETAEEPIKTAVRQALSLTNLVVCKIDHCQGSYATSVTFPNGFKFSYSGDCRPSRTFATMGSGSTVLVHEATFDDDLRPDAVAKKHSTISEAIGVGVRMGAKNVILTHFSQRFSKMPTMHDISRSLSKFSSIEEKIPKEDEVEDGSELIEEDIPIEAEEIPTATQENAFEAASEPQNKSTNESKQTTLPTSPDKGKISTLNTHETFPPLSHSPVALPAIGVAFDYMSVRVRDIPYLNKFDSAFQELYKAEETKLVGEKRLQDLADGPLKDGSENKSKSQNGNGKGKEEDVHASTSQPTPAPAVTEEKAAAGADGG